MLEDFAKISGNLASGLFESGKGVSEAVRAKANSIAKAADLVTRDEFEVIKNMVARIKFESEAASKDVAEIKKQMQVLASSLDVIKEAKSNGNAENNKKLVEDLRAFGEAVEERIKQFEGETKFQQQEIEKLYSLIEGQGQATKLGRGKKLDNQNINQNQSLFDDEQN